MVIEYLLCFVTDVTTVRHEPDVVKSQTTTPMLYKTQKMKQVFSLGWYTMLMMKRQIDSARRRA